MFSMAVSLCTALIVAMVIQCSYVVVLHSILKGYSVH